MTALVVPCEQVSAELLHWLATLPRDAFRPVVVVLDGGSPDAKIEAALRAQEVTLARHAVAVGRGAAIRTGIHAVLTLAPEIENIVVAGEGDAADDLLRVGSKPGALVLASGGVSENFWTRALTGIRLSDPWAAPRSLPAALLPRLLTLEARGDEFDLQTVLAAREEFIAIVEAPAARLPRPRAVAAALLRYLAVARPERAVTRLLAGVCWLIFAAVLGLGAWGFGTGHLFRQFIWLPWGLHRLTHFAALFFGFSAPILAMFPWTYAAVFPALLTAASVLAEGPAAVGAVLLLLLSANALGSLLLRRSPQILATLGGIGVYALLMTLTARIPIHFAALWAVLLALPIAADAHGVVERVKGWGRSLAAIELPTWRQRAALALLLFVLSIQWFAALEPESSADGMGMHLAVCTDIAAHHALTYRPGSYVWSVMPMAADFTYSIAYLLGGEGAASLFNFALLALLAAVVVRAARRFVSPGTAWLIAALFASTPLVNLVTGSLFIENFVALMIVGMALELWRYHETGERTALLAAAILGGTACSAKFGACAFIVVTFACAAVELRRRRAGRMAIAAAAVLLLFAAPPYAIAYAMTHNPVFPFLNAKFPSPLLENGIEFRNNVYTQPLTWRIPFDLTFHTHRYIEGLDGAIGFAWLLLIPLAVAALFAARNYGARIAAVIGLGAGLVVLASQPYARYVYPAMPLLAVPFAHLIARFRARHRALTFALLASAAACILLNIYFTPTSGWHHKSFYEPAMFRAGGRDQVIAKEVPLRDVTRRFRQAHPTEHVLLLVEFDLADAGPTAYEYDWHQYGVWKQIAESNSVTALRGVFSRLGVRYFISRRPGPDDDLLSPWPLAEFMASCTTPILENGRFYAAATTPQCETLDDAALESRLESLPPALVSPGTYDDFDTAIRFHGAWTRTKSFDGPLRHTISYVDAPGADAVFAFEGSSLTYIFTRAPNRGFAELEIDGAPHEIDLYAPAVEWQSRAEFCCLSPGRHFAKLRVTGRKREAAQGAYIDLDGFVAR